MRTSRMEPADYAPGSSEIGSLTASNEDSHFIGSSSGVYFVNTVKRAFSNGLNDSRSEWAAEDTLVGTEDSPQNKRQRTETTNDASASTPGDSLPSWKYDPSIAAILGSAPSQDMGKELMMAYFKVWHSLFPFLHGPTFLNMMERLSTGESEGGTTNDSASDHRNTCWTIILQCVFNIGSLLRPDLGFASECKIQSPASLASLLSTLASRHDVASLQAMLAIQVYLVATMSLRLASTFGGCVLRSMLHAGLHRCPFRYSQLSSHDRQLRKRIFWCAYAIDRYLSQALGLPLGIQDSDIDVCLPAAPEMHSPRLIRALSSSNTDLGRSTSQSPSVLESPGSDPQEIDRQKKESTLASYVHSGFLVGRALELFHKSILVRRVRRNAILFLVSDVHKWWNSLPHELQGSDQGSRNENHSGLENAEKPFNFGPFFTVLYQHLILIIHRPSLSLDPSSAEFCSGLQTCIGAARGIIAALKTQVDSQQALFWPGFLSSVWMSGLVLAFACQLKQYVLTKGLQEIGACEEFLRRMSSQWETARQCQQALHVLSIKIKQLENEHQGGANPYAYEREATLMNSNQIGDTSIPGHGNLNSTQMFTPDAQPEVNSVPFTEGENRTDSSLNEVLNFQRTDTDFPAGGSNFDLNMVDLLEGANFDSLFDLIGQQYPSF